MHRSFGSHQLTVAIIPVLEQGLLLLVLAIRVICCAVSRAPRRTRHGTCAALRRGHSNAKSKGSQIKSAAAPGCVVKCRCGEGFGVGCRRPERFIMYGNDGRENPKVSVTGDRNERRASQRMRGVDMTTICRARLSIDSVELAILLGAHGSRRNGAGVCRLTSEYRGAKLKNDSDKIDRAPDPHPPRSLLGPPSHAYKQ